MGRIVRLTEQERAAMLARRQHAFAAANVEYGYCCCGCGTRTTLRPSNSRETGELAGEPALWVRTHQRRIDPFASYAIEDHGFVTSCWVWKRGLNDKGYGLIYWHKTRGYAHRWFYEQRHGPIPFDSDLDHLCRVRSCVNPDHLQPVTHAENMRRAKATKLTLAQVREIRRRAATEMQKDLAFEYGVSTSHLGQIVKGTRWPDG